MLPDIASLWDFFVSKNTIVEKDKAFFSAYEVAAKGLHPLDKQARFTDKDLKVAAQCAYCWMPTMLKAYDAHGVRKEYLALLNAPDAFNLDQLNRVTEAFISGSIKNKPKVSWVGTSKMLHFLKPRLYPI